MKCENKLTHEILKFNGSEIQQFNSKYVSSATSQHATASINSTKHTWSYTMYTCKTWNFHVPFILRILQSRQIRENYGPQIFSK